MKTTPIEFTTKPTFHSYYWISDCGRYRIVYDEQLSGRYRAFRKRKSGKGYICLSGHATREAAIAACREHAKGKAV